MNILVLKERQADESRVALVPAHLAPLVKFGHTVQVETGAGLLSGYTDAEYKAKGATIIENGQGALGEADVVLAVRAAGADAAGTIQGTALKEGTVVIAMMDPYQPHETYTQFIHKKTSSFALELIPRITRAQSMDVLSSMANLAGYKGVLLAAEHLPKIFPMMMTAAGTVTPAKVFVLGAGVAGLQAIATARRLGAVVSAFDVRPAVKEQVESLGAKFVEFDLGSGAEGSGGYAKELTEEQKKRQQELMQDYVAGMDVIISTAAVPGRPSPKLITREMVKRMAPGSVIVDLASERGGNCELTKPGQVIREEDVTIVGPLNLAATMAFHASQLYSKNITTFLALLMNKEGQLSINTGDEVVAGCLLTHQGMVGSEKIAKTLGLDSPILAGGAA